MEKFFNIKYIDAQHYTGTKEPELFRLAEMEAYGHVEKNAEGDYIVNYVLTDNPILKNKIGEGLILPKGSLLSEYGKKEFQLNCNLEDIDILDKVQITWKDVAHIVNSEQKTCSIMYTEGVIKKIYEDFILLTDTETVRTYPLPLVNHPEDMPLYYAIPKSFITNINKI